MRWNSPLATLGVLLTAAGGYAVWYAFEYPLCTMSSECAPNVPISAGGALAIVVGIGLLLFARNRNESS